MQLTENMSAKLADGKIYFTSGNGEKIYISPEAILTQDILPGFVLIFDPSFPTVISVHKQLLGYEQKSKDKDYVDYSRM